ncbi:D-isomer specific 2-hydroxyacid dehydrogenase, NAD binding subunit [uncultured delta proteobacterium]|uniref:D-isomer specific 2-hydroxyacid dehydrogenase, NAD binding subunit n=1 Tax=uncultured delta proteobacterium TaxID=34034 RepID=A0A212K2K5_9DELT|nr:D-isomer specific 2-hydroxyacid dehydrogenase, NAD binding subunit [uncultured delta proteobacterium]
MSCVIATTSPVFGTVGKVPQFIADRGWELIRCIDKSRPDGGLAEHLGRVDFLVAGLLPVKAGQLDAAPNLKAVLKHGVGVDNIDIAAATGRKIPVLNAPGGNTNAVVELTIGDMIVLARHLPKACADIRNQNWERQVGSEIAGKTLGIVGFGNIGKSLALAASALGMRILATDLYPDYIFAEEHGVTLADMENVLRKADYVTLHIHGGKDNVNCIGETQLAMMKPTAFLINNARGDVVDLDALDRALKNNALAGAAIDAFPVEPPDFSHPIFANPKALLTPHAGGDTAESSERVGMMNVTDIETLLKGGRAPRILNPEIYH